MIVTYDLIPVHILSEYIYSSFIHIFPTSRIIDLECPSAVTFVGIFVTLVLRVPLIGKIFYADFPLIWPNKLY